MGKVDPILFECPECGAQSHEPCLQQDMFGQSFCVERGRAYNERIVVSKATNAYEELFTRATSISEPCRATCEGEQLNLGQEKPRS
jgi:hypothetical protein